MKIDTTNGTPTLAIKFNDGTNPLTYTTKSATYDAGLTASRNDTTKLVFSYTCTYSFFL